MDPARVVRIVNHPVRMRIIELLAARPMSWKELSGELGVKTGSLYHHLDTLERIVTRDSEKKYALTRLGMEIFAQLNDEKKTPAQSLKGIEKAMTRRTPAGAVREVFVPRSLVVHLTATRARAAASLAGFSLLALALLLSSGDELVLFSFSPSAGAGLSVATYAGSLVALTAVGYLALAFAFRERADLLTLAASTALSFVPLLAFGEALHLAGATGGSPFPISLMADSATVTVAFAFFQAWGAGVIGAGMSAASGLRVEKALMVSLVVLYATMLIVLAQGGRLT